MELFAFSKIGKYTAKKYRLVLFVWLTVFFFFVEIIVGYITNSLTLIADSFHMLTNIAAIVVSLLSLNTVTKKWSKNTFGWARAEILGALVNAVFLVALCFSITTEAIKRCLKEMPLHDPELVVAVGALGFIVNFIGFCTLYEHHRTTNAAAPNQNRLQMQSGNFNLFNIRHACSLMLGDSIGSIIVMISALSIWKTNWQFRYHLDPIMTMFLVFLMLHSIWPSMRESALILLQTVPTHIEVDAIRKRLLETVDDVLEVHEFHVWRLAGDRIIASAHIRCCNLADYMKIAEKVKEFFHNEGIHSTTIQPEFIDDIENGDFSQMNEFCALDCPVTEEGCMKSTCCQYYNNSKSNQLPAATSSAETHRQGNANNGNADDIEADELVE